MATCPACKVRHSPYTCAQYQQLRRAENAADDLRAGDRRDISTKHEDELTRRRTRRRLRRRRPRSI
jgi:hypothetical protein